MQKTGEVTRIDGGRMAVRFRPARPEACRSCRACEALGGAGGEMVLRVSAVEGVRVGDRVTVTVPEASPWVGIVLVLGLPTALMIAGLVLGSRWAWWVDLLGLDGDLAGAALGVPLGVAAFVLARAVDRRYVRRIVVRRAEPGDLSEGDG